MIKLVRKLVPTSVKGILKRGLYALRWDPWQYISWSQEGEDQILRRIFDSQLSGFYIDVGAHHPKRFSNTYLFYRRGWRGINIDAMPGSMRQFNKERPRDLNLEVGIGVEEKSLDYFVFNEPALNGFSKKITQERSDTNSNYQIKEVFQINMVPLSFVLDNHLPKSQVIDFMSVDVEGMDLEVLKSNNWTKYRPQFVLAEILGSCLYEIQQSEIGQLMGDAGYVLYAKCMNTVFFKDSN